ncbi:MAG: T9SS type A sorting domain-containing protein [Bacteroidetes bacterium]|nr:T9SS type A sorting domain-containing protein [Bacteroidota bacterium]
MKTYFTMLALCVNFLLVAQNFMYRHINTDENTVATLARLDHPMLNGNPDARIVVTHNWEPFRIYNDHVTGVIYNSSTNLWFLVNEDGAPMLEDVSYNIYIAQDDEIIVHQATEANQGVTPNITLIDHPALNDNFGRIALITPYRQDPDFIVNNHNHGIYYNNIADRRGIYTEDGQPIPEDASFFVYISGIESNVATFRHQADEDNTFGNSTAIDHSLLNNNPEAVFLAGHYFGVLPNSDEINDSVISVWYDTITNRWNVYNEDLTNMPEGIVFDLIIYDESLSINDEVLQQISVVPNPASHLVTLQMPNNVLVSEVQVFNGLGQLVMNLNFNGVSSNQEIDVSDLNSGVYLVTIATNSGMASRKIIKQ